MEIICEFSKQKSMWAQLKSFKLCQVLNYTDPGGKWGFLCFVTESLSISQIQSRLKNSNMRFATKRAFSRFVLKAELFLSRCLT